MSGGMPSARKRGVSLADVRYLTATWALLVFYRIALAFAPYRLVRRVLPVQRTPRSAPSWALARTRWAVSNAARAAFGATCLPQALAANALLSLQGYGSVIRIGVRRGESGAVQAHAWVLSDDRVVVGDDGECLESFTPLTDLGPRA